jgi:hypothetical protein
MQRNFTILLLSIFLINTPLQATSVIQYALPELIKKADAILRAKVISKKVLSTPTSVIPLKTEIVIELLEIYKSQTKLSLLQQLTIHTAGGILKNRSVVIPGTTPFTLNEEVVLFLEKKDETTWLVLGLSQGKFEITQDLQSGEKKVTQNIQGLHMVNKPNPHKSARNNSHSLSLSNLEKEIRRNLKN